MQAATLSSSPGSEKGCFRGRGSSWCPSAGLAEPSGGMGFCSGSPAPWRLHFSRRVSLLHLVLQNRPFPAENQQPHMEALVSRVARKVEGGKLIKDVPHCDKEPLAPAGAGKSPSALYGPSLLVVQRRLARLPLLLLGCQPGKNALGAYWSEGWWEDARGESVSPCTNVEHLLNAYPTGCHVCYRAASVPVPGGCQPSQTGPGCRVWAP